MLSLLTLIIYTCLAGELVVAGFNPQLYTTGKLQDCGSDGLIHIKLVESKRGQVMYRLLIRLFESANEEFLYREKDFILSGVQERALCASLMVYIMKRINNSCFHNYYVDVEYNRNNGKIKTIVNDKEEIVTINCDLIVHSRGEIIEQDNLIALEMKKSTASRKEKEKDKQRLIALTKDTFDNVWSYDGTSLPEHVCRYKLGIYYEVNIRRSKVYIEYYKKGKLTNSYDVSFYKEIYI